MPVEVLRYIARHVGSFVLYRCYRAGPGRTKRAAVAAGIGFTELDNGFAARPGVTRRGGRTSRARRRRNEPTPLGARNPPASVSEVMRSYLTYD